MPWVKVEHECRKPYASWRYKPPGSMWQCPSCGLYWTVTEVRDFGLPWFCGRSYGLTFEDYADE